MNESFVSTGTRSGFSHDPEADSSARFVVVQLPSRAWRTISVRLEKTNIVRLGVVPEACGVKAAAQRRWTSRTGIRLVVTAHECIGR